MLSLNFASKISYERILNNISCCFVDEDDDDDDGDEDDELSCPLFSAVYLMT